MNSKIGRKLITYFLFTTFLIGFASFFSYFNSSSLLLKIRSMFEENVDMNNIITEINTIEGLLQTYLISNNQDILKEFKDPLMELQDQSGKIKYRLVNNDNMLMKKNIKNMLGSYISKVEQLLKGDPKALLSESEDYFNTSELSKLILFSIDDMLLRESKENSKNYFNTFESIKFNLYLSVGVLVLAIVFNIILTVWFTYKISRPLVELSGFANQVANNNFNIDTVEVRSNDEIGDLANSFNIMVKSIREYIENIKEKAGIENKLREQEKQNLEIKSLLKTTELNALQAQINPHFLYNTLNAGSQLAILEEADKTGEFLLNVSNLFRYNLSSLNIAVTLMDELSHVDMYMYILKTRFPEKIRFEKHIDENYTNIVMPRMILQPIIENAYVHGISELERGGTIKLKTYKQEDSLRVVIEDNGFGMDKKQIEDIMTFSQKHKSQNQSTGIGMENIIQRLRLFYGSNDVIKITSKKNAGTRIELIIPV